MDYQYTSSAADTRNNFELSGGVMTGPLILYHDPATGLEATTKQYVDTLITDADGRITTIEGNVASIQINYATLTYVNTQVSGKVSRSGDTMTGTFALAADPTANMHAATKQYVDAGDSALDTRVAAIESSLSNLSASDNTRVAKSGDTMTGFLVLHANPVINMHPATKQYVDSSDSALSTRLTSVEDIVSGLTTDTTSRVSKSGDTMTGFLTLSANPTSGLHAATKTYVDSGLSSHASDASLHISSTQNTFLDGISVTSTEVNRISGVTSNIQTQIDALNAANYELSIYNTISNLRLY